MTTCSDDEKTLADAQAQVQMLESAIFRDLPPYDLITLTESGEELVIILREQYNDLKLRLEEKLSIDQAQLTKIKSANERLRSLKSLVDQNFSTASFDYFRVRSNIFINAYAPLLDKSYPKTSPDEPI
jgi:hypothetical protein